MNRPLKFLIFGLLGLVAYTVSASALVYGLFGFSFADFRGYEIWPYILSYTTDEASNHAKWRVIAAAVLPLAIGLLTFVLFVFKPRQIYGDARWAEASDLRAAGLTKSKGVILGKKSGKFLMSDDKTHLLLVAPTRSGKGVGIIIPNCLSWQGSMVVLDVKLENYKITAGFRAKYGHKTYLWSPMSTDKRSARFNPLDMVSKDPDHRISDIQIIATLLVDVSERDPMWGQEARSLFVGAALYVMDNPDIPSTLGGVYRFLSSGDDIKQVCETIIETEGDTLDPTVRRAIGSFASKAAKEASGVANTLISALRIFENPVVDAATSASDFDIRDLRRKRMSVYVGALPAQIETLAPLLRLFFQQVITVMSSSDPGPDEPHQVLMLLDEFPSIGAMDSIVSAFTLLAGYNVRVMAVIQGLSWIDKNYGKDTREGLVANCAHQIYFAPNDDTTARHISDALGETTKRQTSYMKNPLALSAATGTKTISATGRPLLMPQEVRRLDDRKSIVLVEGAVPVMADKVRYYESPVFKKRLLPPPPVRALDTTRRPQARMAVAPPPAAPTSTPKPVVEGEAWVTEDDIRNDAETRDLADQLLSIFSAEGVDEGITNDLRDLVASGDPDGGSAPDKA